MTHQGVWRGHKLWWAGALLACLLLWLAGGGPLLALLLKGSEQQSGIWLAPYLRHLIFFTLLQAGISTLLSVGFAIPAARAINRRHFPGKRLFIRLLSLSQVLPVIIALFGIIAVHGQQGWLPTLLRLMGYNPDAYIYGLSGILLAHLFFNLPLATRYLLTTQQQIPAEQWRLATQLGLPSMAIWRYIEWPAMKKQILPVATLIFMLCFSSFTTVMALGGGPNATTLEVAIYQAVRFDFELDTAASLAICHLLLSGAVLLLHHQQHSHTQAGGKIAPTCQPPGPRGKLSLLMDTGAVSLLCLIYLPPLFAILQGGLQPSLPDALRQPQLWLSLFCSLKIALSAATLATFLSLLLLFSSRHLRLRLKAPHWATLIESHGSLILLVPTSVLSTGLFILLIPYADIFAWGFYLVIVLNSIAALPYTLRLLSPALHSTAQEYDKLADSLGLRGFARWRLLEWPKARPAIAQAAALAAIFSLGDLGAVAMFGSQDMQTLPWLLFQQLGSYQISQAAVTALILLLLCLGLFTLIEKGLGGKP
ncbi:MAG: thiamine/thiamine pyrophosphate ABC transporter permease [Aeromonadaceae bacterium]|nr:thiamine/thiamine pyrophosphate ABC transporter permease [Aeromonadaceae bacterium]